MVRLKVNLAREGLNGNEISIPYGAIKSEIPATARILVPHFNSLWCD